MNRERRIELHGQAKEQMKKGEYRLAAETLSKARSAFGENLLLLIDLTVCEYMLGRLFRWRELLKEIEDVVEETRELLTPQTLYNAHLFLGKFLEEQGQFKNALRSYESVVEGEEFSDRQKIMCLAGLVRVAIFLGLEQEAESSYIDLSTRVRAFEAENQRIEVLHSLMWGEFAFVGLEASIARYLRAREHVDYACDLSLLYFDLAELVFIRQPVNRSRFKDLVLNPPEPINAFEVALSKLLEVGTLTYREAFAKADEMSVTTQVRLGFLVSRFGTEAVDRLRATRLISTLLKSFDPFSARALASKFGLTLPSETVTEIRVGAASVNVGDEQLNWRRRTTALSLLSVLADQRSLEVESAVKQVWNADYNASYGERLRILVRRINEDLQAIALKPEILVLNSGRIAVAEGISLNRA